MNAAAALAVLPTRAPPALGERLDAARAAVEGRFLEAGEVLGQAVESLGQLISSVEQLGRTLDIETVTTTTAELKAAAMDLLALPARHSGRRSAIDRLVGASDRLTGGIDDMRRNLAYLRVFAIDIKITAGSIAIVGSEFGAFAQEICDRIETGAGHLNAFDADLQGLRRIFKTATGLESALADHCQTLLATVPGQLAATASDIVAHHERIAQVAEEVSSLARSVQKKVGAALGALQIGDITRQRIEHVGQGLDSLQGTDVATPDQRDRLTRFINGLLAAQLRAASDDFHRDVGRVGLAIDGIAEDAVELLRLRNLAFGRADGGDQSFIRRLESHVGQALSLVDDVASADQRALQLGGSAGAASASLNGRITALRSIKTDVQEMALNTTLRCYRAGEVGKPLSVIAVELRAYADRMEVSAQEALSALDVLSQDAGRLAAADDGDLASSVGVALANVSQRLRQAGDSVDADLAALASQGEAAVKTLRLAAGGLDFGHDIGVILDEVAGLLSEQAGEDAPSIDDVGAPLATLLEALMKSYTMAQERDVQRNFTAGLDLASADELVEAAAEADAPADEPSDPDDVFF